MAINVFRHPIRGLSLALAGAIALANGPAIAQTTAGSSSEDLLYRLQVLDAEIADIRARLGVGTGTAAGRPAAGDAAGLEAEIRRLTARLEQIERAQREMRADLTRRLGDIEFRLNELEGVPNDGTPKPVAGDIDKPAETNTAAGPAASVSERNRLNAAIEDVKQGRYDQGEDRLRAFMREYPDSPLNAEALNWMGQSLATRGLHRDAAKSYLSGYSADRGGPLAADNLLGLGISLGRLGEVNDACLTLREVRARFPGTDASTKADEVADELAC